MCYHWFVVVVIDTDVVVAALLTRGGASREVLRRALRRDCVPLMGTTLFTEYESVLARRELFARCALSGAERESLLDAFLSVCRWTRIFYTWRPNVPDESDNHIVELAVAGGAHAIVTRNVRDFVGAELKFEGLRIMTPQQFIKE